MLQFMPGHIVPGRGGKTLADENHPAAENPIHAGHILLGSRDQDFFKLLGRDSPSPPADFQEIFQCCKFGRVRGIVIWITDLVRGEGEDTRFLAIVETGAEFQEENPVVEQDQQAE
jgi:hypothetical protein